MRPSRRIVLLAATGVFLLSPVWPDRVFSEQPDNSSETPQTPPHLLPETEPAPPKSSTEPKSQPQPAPPTKPDPPHKLSTEPKPPPQSTPTAKPAPEPEREVKEKGKDANRKPLGSLILTVKLALLADIRLSHYEIEVGVNDQTVALEGRVASEDDKTAATDVVKSVPGVKAVVNKLEMDKGLAQALIKKRDENITGLVKERFAKSATLKAANFDVKTEDGIVSISGAVRFQVIALEAAEAARQVPGVKAVKTDKVRLEGEG